MDKLKAQADGYTEEKEGGGGDPTQKPKVARRVTIKTASDQKDWYDGVAGNESENEDGNEEDRATWWFPSNPPGYDKMTWFRWFFLLFEHPDKCRMSTYISAFIFLLIFISSLSSWIETIPSYRYPVQTVGLINKDYMDDSTGPGNKGECPGPGCQQLGFIIVNQICMTCFLCEYLIRAISVWGSDVSPWYDVEIDWRRVQKKSKRGQPLYYEEGPNLDKPIMANSDENSYLEYYHPEFNNAYPTEYSTGRDMEYLNWEKTGQVPPRMSGCRKWWEWTWKALSLVDLVSVMPFVLDILAVSKHMKGMVALRYLRLVRVFRVMKLQKQTIAVALFVNTVILSAGPLVVLLFFTALMIVVFGAIVFQVEKGNFCPGAFPSVDSIWEGKIVASGASALVVADAPACPKAGVAYKAFEVTRWKGLGGYTDAELIRGQASGDCTLPTPTCQLEGKWMDTCCGVGDGCYCRMDMMGEGADSTPFYSTFMSMWWVLTTITTVGYGDTFPTSVLGRVMGSIAMILGVVGFSMPISIIGNSFEEEYRRLSATAGAIDKALGVTDMGKNDPRKDVPGVEMFKACVMAAGRNKFHPSLLAAYARTVSKERKEDIDVPMQV